MIRLGLDQLPVVTLVAFRVGGGALALWAYILWAGHPLPRRPGPWAAMLVMGLLNNVIPFSLIAWGEQHIESGLAAILNGSTTILSVLAAALILKDERLTRQKCLGVAFGFAGLATITGIDSLTQLDPTSLGQLALIGAAAGYALSAVWARLTLQGVAPQVAAAGMTTGSTLVMLPWALWQDGVPSFAWTAVTWGAVLYLALAATAVAYILYYRVLTLAGAANLSVVTLVVAPIAILLGAVVLDEKLPPAAYAGFALLALGLVVLDGRIWQRLARRRAPAAAE
jgi:drug/metabolite transporter (DMT)-like permease